VHSRHKRVAPTSVEHDDPQFLRCLDRSQHLIERHGLELHVAVNCELGFRHVCGFALANQGRDTCGLQAYLGHRYIQPTVGYTELSSDRFKGWWKD
jgi:site-specific recombinase XerD